MTVRSRKARLRSRVPSPPQSAQERADRQRKEKVRQRRIARLVRIGWWQAAVSVFIVWHLFAVSIWLLPGSALGQWGSPLVRPYMTLTSFTQNWMMFAPNPDRRDIFVEARVACADGTTQSWTFPRMARLGYAERYRRERYRKMIEVAQKDQNRLLWPSLARYAARQCALETHRRPVTVTLVRHIRVIPPPGQPLSGYRQIEFFSTHLTPKDLL